MNAAAALRVDIGSSAPALPGFLRMHRHQDADVPFQIGDEFPFEDRAVEVLVTSEYVDALPRAGKLQFLLECRRVLTPGGILRGEGWSRTEALAGIAAMVGLAPAADTPLSNVAAVALLQLREARGDAALELRKPDRQRDADALVSVLIPAFNPRFFPAALDSALAQTYANIEIVICDDSPDATIEDVVRSRAHGHIRYARNEVRLGARGNFTRCFERAEGQFVKFLCDDDLLAPTCISSLLDAFGNAPDIALATSRRQRIDADGEHLHDQPATLPVVSCDSVISGWSLANAMLMAGLNTIGEPSTTLFRKADLLDRMPGYFGFDGDPGHGIIDMATWAALLLQGDAVYLRECLSSFRIHSGQSQHDPAKFQRNIDSIRRLQSSWLALRLHERLPPDRLLIKPYPSTCEGGWREQSVSGFAAHRVAQRSGAAPTDVQG